jgi:hypothetical protein
MKQIFVSYAKEDHKKVESLVRALEAKGWSVWWDQSIPLGKTYDEVIQSALDGADVVIVVWTRHSVSSRWVRSEAERAANQQKLFPVMMEEVQLPLAFSLLHAVNLGDWYGNRAHQGFDQLVKEISGVVTPMSLPTLQRKSKVIKEVPILQNMWPLIALVGLPIVLIAILSNMRIQAVGIQLQVKVTEFNFVSSEEQELSVILVPTVLKVAGLKEIRIPRAKGRPPQTIDVNNSAGKAINLSRVRDYPTAGSISLAPLSLSAGTSVRLYTGKKRQKYHVSLQRSEFPIRATVQGVVAVGLPAAPREIFDFGPPKPLLLQSSGTGVDLELSLAHPRSNLLTAPLSINSLSLYRLDEQVGKDRSLVQHVSTILSGTFSFDSEKDQSQNLSLSEEILLKKPIGKIHEIRLHEDHLEIAFKGYVQELKSCFNDNCSSLKPTYLKWLTAQYRLLSIVITMVYFVFVILISLLWWRTRKGRQSND